MQSLVPISNPVLGASLLLLGGEWFRLLLQMYPFLFPVGLLVRWPGILMPGVVRADYFGLQVLLVSRPTAGSTNGVFFFVFSTDAHGVFSRFTLRGWGFLACLMPHIMLADLWRAYWLLRLPF